MEQKIKMFIVGGCLICLICCVKVLNTMNDKLAYIKEKAEYIEEQGRAQYFWLKYDSQNIHDTILLDLENMEYTGIRE